MIRHRTTPLNFIDNGFVRCELRRRKYRRTFQSLLQATNIETSKIRGKGHLISFIKVVTLIIK